MLFQRQNKVIHASRVKRLLFGGMRGQMHKQCANANITLPLEKISLQCAGLLGGSFRLFSF